MVVVGLLAAFLATFAHGSADKHVVASPTTGPLAPWTSAPHLVGQPVAPILAPSDPSVVYEAAVTDSNGEHVFRRSDDAGATWRDLPVPNDGGMSAYPFTLSGLDLWVDPANAKNVISTLARGLPEQYCPNQRVDVACQLQYFSADGGEHWSKMHFPVLGSITLTERVSQRTLDQPTIPLLQSQGTRLFTAVSSRIVASQDRGATWRLADTGLYAADRHICDFVAAPDATTLYATTGAPGCDWKNPSSVSTLWRSDDAGAQWTRVKKLPGAGGFLIGAFKSPDHANFTVYIAVTDGKLGLKHAWASEDGGQTWTEAPDPAPGAPEGQQVRSFLSEPRDGSLIITNSLKHGKFLSWRPGQANWRQIAQPLEGDGTTDFIYAVEQYSQQGGHTLCAVTASLNSARTAKVFRVLTVPLS
jgi:hypothetical protein